jgi:hypothetical protein
MAFLASNEQVCEIDGKIVRSASLSNCLRYGHSDVLSSNKAKVIPCDYTEMYDYLGNILMFHDNPNFPLAFHEGLEMVQGFKPLDDCYKYLHYREQSWGHCDFCHRHPPCALIVDEKRPTTPPFPPILMRMHGSTEIKPIPQPAYVICRSIADTPSDAIHVASVCIHCILGENRCVVPLISTVNTAIAIGATWFGHVRNADVVVGGKCALYLDKEKHKLLNVQHKNARKI